jgi:CBS domain-containing protein
MLNTIMPAHIDSESLMAVLRQPPYLSPVDSAFRAVELLRHSGVDTLPVVDSRDMLCGVVSLPDLSALLRAKGAEEALLFPVAHIAHWPMRLGRASMSLDEARHTLAESEESTLVILDEDGRYLGVVTLLDLLLPVMPPPRPASVGGMATPWGVYLTNGWLQAGVSNSSLWASGILLGALLIVAYLMVGAGSWMLERAFGWPLYTLWNSPRPAQIDFTTLDWFLLQAFALPLFLGLLRALPIAGYHAAEHQAVHALERGEPLRLEVVRRMPRVHPRCGTNLLAGGLLFVALSQGIPAASQGVLGSADGAILGALITLLTWKRVGSFLQYYFTTRPATDEQLACGIAAAEELQHKFLHTLPRRPTFWRRFWCMGVPQVAGGIAIGTTVALLLSEWLLSL